MNPRETRSSKHLAKLWHRYRLPWGAVLVVGVATVAVWLSSRPNGSDPLAPKPHAAVLPPTRIQPISPDSGGASRTMRLELSQALGSSGGIPVPSRIRRLMEMREALVPGEVEELLRGLLGRAGPEDLPAERSTWFHEVANLIHRQQVDDRSFAEVLATVARDTSRDVATRDYALQHLRRIWTVAEPSLREAIESTLLEMAELPGALQATALLSLHLIDPDGRQRVNDTGLRQIVVSALTAASKPGRDSLGFGMAAARIAGERQMTGQRARLMEIASSPDDHALLRMSAVSALAAIGDSADLAALTALQPGDGRVEAAIRHAAARR